MNEKSLITLEYPKILDHLASYCAFNASVEKVLALRPSSDIEAIQHLQAQTSEALLLLRQGAELSIGGARDVRSWIDLAMHGGILDAYHLLEIKSTLIATRNLSRKFERLTEVAPELSELAASLPSPPGVIDSISNAVSDRGEILDSASLKLASLRHDIQIVHDRLLSKLQRMISDPKILPYLQEALITQRDGRYVIPLRTEFKGRIRAISHDQSASGATLFVEPLAVVDLNNQYRELQLAERDEERRILADLSQLMADFGVEILQCVDTIATIDMAFARAKYAEHLNASEPRLKKIDPKGERHPGSIIRLYQARHPLLEPETVVPIDVELDPQTYILVITGPNTGGKTVTLKTVGLLALMAQSGLHIPVSSGSEISIFHNIYSDIGDEQSIEQSLSTFSGHITNIIHILDVADRFDLVILDELGAGTDPQEGSALARAILSHLVDRRITTLVTTHHPELKAYAHAVPGVVNASVEFDLDTLQPTYHLTIGLPGRSNALAIAQRLGLPESIISSARQELNPEDLQVDNLLDEILRQRDLAQQARSEAEISRQQVQALRAELLERLDKIEDERLEILEAARHDAEIRVKQLEAEINETRRNLARARQPLDIIKPIQESLSQLQGEVELPTKPKYHGDSPIARNAGIGQQRAIRLGDQVYLRSLKTRGIVTTISENEAEIRVGVMRIRAHPADLELLTDNVEVPPVPNKSVITAKSTERTESSEFNESDTTTSSLSAIERPIHYPSPGFELDLRGQRAEEALELLESYLEKAFLAGLPFVRIIHGKGTGRLRDVVRQLLKNHPHVVRFEPGNEQEGGDGVTIANLS